MTYPTSNPVKGRKKDNCPPEISRIIRRKQADNAKAQIAETHLELVWATFKSNGAIYFFCKKDMTYTRAHSCYPDHIGYTGQEYTFPPSR